MNYINEIKRLSKEKDALILAHNYQPPEIQELADITGDSLELARLGLEAQASTLVICGVYFMAETAKMLSPEKKVLIPRPDAGCPLAEQLTPETVRAAKTSYPGSPFVVYVNSTAATKAECDITCTSANAVTVVASLLEETVLFGPDANLAAYVQRQLPEKKIITVPQNGDCPTHHQFSVHDVEAARREHPDATIFCHPECSPDVQLACDLVGSTGSMMRNCGDKDEWVLLTEKGMVHPLQKKYPNNHFHIFDTAICPTMKLTRLEDLYRALRDDVHQVEVPNEIVVRAKAAILRMIEASR